MDPTVLSPWVGLALGIVSLATAVWAIISKPGAKAQGDVADLSKKIDNLITVQNSKIDGLGSKIDKLEERTAVIEAEMEHLPDRDATHRLELAIVRLEGRFDAIDERLNPVSAMANRFQEYMLRER